MKSPSEDTRYGTYSYNGCLWLEHFKPFAFPPCVLTIVSLPVDMATHASAPTVEPTAATTSPGAAPIAGIAASTPAIVSTVPSTAMNARLEHLCSVLGDSWLQRWTQRSKPSYAVSTCVKNSLAHFASKKSQTANYSWLWTLQKNHYVTLARKLSV